MRGRMAPRQSRGRKALIGVSAYCGRTTDGGSWTKVMSAAWPFCFSGGIWNEHDSAANDPGYLEGYGGPNPPDTLTWQVLCLR